MPLDPLDVIAKHDLNYTSPIRTTINRFNDLVTEAEKMLVKIEASLKDNDDAKNVRILMEMKNGIDTIFQNVESNLSDISGKLKLLLLLGSMAAKINGHETPENPS